MRERAAGTQKRHIMSRTTCAQHKTNRLEQQQGWDITTLVDICCRTHITSHHITSQQNTSHLHRNNDNEASTMGK
jgi:hypothetical protein